MKWMRSPNIDQSSAPLPRVLSCVGSTGPRSALRSGLSIVLEVGGERPRYVATEAQHLARKRERHEQLGDGLVRDLLHEPVEVVEHPRQRRGAARHQFEHHAKRQAGTQAQQPGQQVAPELDRLLERRIERLRDLRLETRLLMEADRQVRKQHLLGAGLADRPREVPPRRS